MQSLGHSGVVYKAQLTSKNGKRKDTVAAKTVQGKRLQFKLREPPK